jgi:NAD(P)-dependent dehydrogenase (short-subunit alcohol dehydrogenase family)
MALDLSGKNAFITGAAGGLGWATAKRLIDHGARVFATDIRHTEAVDKLPGASFFECDVSVEQQVADAFGKAEQTLGKLDIAINNAGLTHLGGTLEEMDADYFQFMQRVNVNGVFHGLKHAPAYMNDGGSIINTASLAAFMYSSGTAAYNASKAAVVSLTKSAALELGPRGIRVNAACPGHTMVDRPGFDEEEKGAVAEICRVATALGRHAEADEQAAVFHFLAADESRYITGQALIVDGGCSLGHTPLMEQQILG